MGVNIRGIFLGNSKKKKHYFVLQDDRFANFHNLLALYQRRRAIELFQYF